MLAGQKSLTIQAPAAAVLAVVGDIEGYPDWHPFFLSVRPTARDAQGRVIAADCRHNASVTTLSTVLEFIHADSAVTARRRGGDLRALEGVFEVREEDGASVVTHRLLVDPGARLGLLLRGPVEERVRTRVLEGALDGLQAQLARGG